MEYSTAQDAKKLIAELQLRCSQLEQNFAEFQPLLCKAISFIHPGKKPPGSDKFNRQNTQKFYSTIIPLASVAADSDSKLFCSIVQADRKDNDIHDAVKEWVKDDSSIITEIGDGSNSTDLNARNKLFVADETKPRRTLSYYSKQNEKVTNYARAVRTLSRGNRILAQAEPSSSNETEDKLDNFQRRVSIFSVKSQPKRTRSRSSEFSFGPRKSIDSENDHLSFINYENKILNRRETRAADVLKSISFDSIEVNPPSSPQSQSLLPVENYISNRSTIVRVPVKESALQIPEIIMSSSEKTVSDVHTGILSIPPPSDSEKFMSHLVKQTQKSENFLFAIPILRNSFRKSFLIPAYSDAGSILSVVKSDSVHSKSLCNNIDQCETDTFAPKSLEYSIWKDASISYEIQLSVAYSAIISIRNIVDIFLELVTFKSNHPAMNSLALADKTMKFLRRHYLKTNFFIDLITVFPLELLPIPNSEYLWVIRLFKVHKLHRAIMTSPIYKQFRFKMQNAFKIGHSASLVFPLGFIFFVFLHVEACIIFLGGRLNGYSNSDIAFVENSGFWGRYSWSLHKATANIFPSGYLPSNPQEEIIVVVFAILGAILYACIVGAVSSIAIGYDVSGRLFKQKVDELKEYMNWRNLDPTTQRKVFKYFDLKYREKYFDELALLNEMNESLRNEIAVQNCKELISKVPFLRRDEKDGRDELFLGRISSALEPCYYIAGDAIFVQGEVGEDM
ncbi:anaphase-promoting complex subunit Hcn1, partial [Physocladia obscura]